jgi:hypothetical protein
LGGTVVSQSGASTEVLPTYLPQGTNGAPLIVSSQTGGPGSLSGPLAKLELDRKISPSAKLIFTAGRDLTDASSSFSNQTTGVTSINSVSPAASTSDNYRMTYATAGWQYKLNRTTLAVTARWEKDIYPALSTLDVTDYGVGFNVERKLTRHFTAQLLGNWYKSDYPHAALPSQVIGSTDYANSILGASLTWRHGRALEVRFRCDHDSYTVSNGNTGYHETRAFLTVGYRPMSNPATEELPER